MSTWQRVQFYMIRRGVFGVALDILMVITLGICCLAGGVLVGGIGAFTAWDILSGNMPDMWPPDEPPAQHFDNPMR